MDQGIIRALKSHFRKNLVLKIIDYLDTNEDSSANHPKVTILDAILMIYDAWTKITQETVFNCFRHAGFVRDNLDCPRTSISADFDDEDDVPLSIWLRAIDNQLPIANEELEQYAAIDDAVLTCEEPSDYNIVQNVIVNSQDSDDDNDESEEIWSAPSVSEALQAAETLNVFVHCNFDDDTMKSIMSRLHNAVRYFYYSTKSCNQKQTKITHFLR